MNPKNEIVFPDYEPPKTLRVLFKIGITLILLGAILEIDPKLPLQFVAFARSIVAFFLRLPPSVLLLIVGSLMVIPYAVYQTRS